MYYPGQPIRIHPKLANLEQRSYYNTTGYPVQDTDEPDFDEVTYFNPEMVHLAGTTQRVLSWVKETGTIKIQRNAMGYYWSIIPDWILPTQTFKEL